MMEVSDVLEFFDFKITAKSERKFQSTIAEICFHDYLSIAGWKTALFYTELDGFTCKVDGSKAYKSLRWFN